MLSGRLTNKDLRGRNSSCLMETQFTNKSRSTTRPIWISFKNFALVLTWTLKTVNICRHVNLILERSIIFFPKLPTRNNRKGSSNHQPNFDHRLPLLTSCVKKTNASNLKNLQNGNRQKSNTIENKLKLISLILTIERKWVCSFMISTMTLDSSETTIFQTILTDKESSRGGQLLLILLLATDYPLARPKQGLTRDFLLFLASPTSQLRRTSRRFNGTLV